MDTVSGMRAYVAVVAAGSFTAAAERLGMSKALASKYVRQLETRLGTRLLNRTTRSLSPTEAGRAYFQQAQRLLEELDELEASMGAAQAVPRGHLLVAAPVTFGEMYLVDAAADFLAAQPQVSLEFRLSDRFVNLVDEGLDLAVRIGRLDDSGLVARRLGASRLVACAAPAYLAHAGRPAHPRDLDHHDCVLDANHRGPGWRFEAVTGEAIEVRPRGRFRANSAAAARKMALDGGGVALSPGYVVADDLAGGRLERVLTGFTLPETPIQAVYPHARHLAAKVRAFVDFLQQRFADRRDWLA